MICSNENYRLYAYGLLARSLRSKNNEICYLGTITWRLAETALSGVQLTRISVTNLLMARHWSDSSHLLLQQATVNMNGMLCQHWWAVSMSAIGCIPSNISQWKQKTLSRVLQKADFFLGSDRLMFELLTTSAVADAVIWRFSLSILQQQQRQPMMMTQSRRPRAIHYRHWQADCTDAVHSKRCYPSQ